MINPLIQSKLSKREIDIEIKKKNFWGWNKKSNQREESFRIDLDKRIPGFASIIAIALFLIREYIIVQGEDGNFFTDMTFTVSLQILNIVVLFIILLRGLKISNIKQTDLIPSNPGSANNNNSDKIDIEYIVVLEKQFVRFIKCFFGMTLALYFVLISKSFIDADVLHKAGERENLFKEIVKGRDEIRQSYNDLKKINYSDSSITHFGAFINDYSKTNTDTNKSKNSKKNTNNFIKVNNIDSTKLPISVNQFNTIDCTLKKITEYLVDITYYDIKRKNYDTDKKHFLITNLKNIKNTNSTLTEVILEIDESIKNCHNYDSSIKLIYQGNHRISKQTEKKDNDNIGIIITGILSLICSNLGALFLVYCFLVLYAKTLDVNSYKKEETFSLLAFKNLFIPKTKHDEEQKKIIVIIYVLYSILFAFTFLQIILECCLPNFSDLNTIFSMLSGLCMALALSLLIARFESTSFNSTFSVLVILYLYANIQMLFGVFTVPLFNNPHLIEDIVLLIAFLGKCFLYLYILWIVRTDRLKYYFYRKFDNTVPIDEKMHWEEFVELLT